MGIRRVAEPGSPGVFPVEAVLSLEAVLAVTAALALTAASGCARNPTTGRPQMMLITERQEFDIGQGADAQIRKEEGVYLEQPALRAYVEGVGSALSAHSERSGLVFHIEVLDTPQINAFALPGGFVYVTRGMLERLSSEDELAVVLGHEIGHVAARHGAARLSTLYALQYGSLVGAIITPRTFAHYNDLIDLGIHVALSGYSREQESQADRLGVGYAHDAGYRAGAAVTVMEILQWLEGDEPGALEKWFLSHPPAGERIEHVRAEAAAREAADPSAGGRQSRRDAYLRHIDGLLVGMFNGSELVLRDRYYNRELAVSLEVPAGWDVNLDPNGALVAVARADAEFVFLEAEPISKEISAADVTAEFDKTLRRRGWTRTGGHEAATVQDVPVRLATYEGRTAKGEPIGALKAFLVHDKRRWTYTAVAGRDRFEETREERRSGALDIRFLTQDELAALGPPRLEVIEAGAQSTWESLAAERLGSPSAGQRLAFYNGLPADRAPGSGTLVKIPPSLSLRPR